MDQRLTDLLSRLSALRDSSSAPHVSINASELELLGDALLPSAPARTRSLAYLCLTKHAEVSRAGSDRTESSADPVLLSSLGRYLLDAVSDTQAQPIRRALALLTALFQVEPKLSAELFQTEGFLDGLVDLVDLPYFANQEEALDVRIAVADLLSEACGVSSLRSLVHARTSDWLSSNITGPAISLSSPEEAGSDDRPAKLRIACAVALTKLAKAIEADPKLTQFQDGNEAPKKPPKVQDLTSMLQDLVVSSAKPGGAQHGSNMVQAVEGLAYASLEPRIKRSLCADKAFLEALVTLASPPSANLASSGVRSAIAPSYNLKLDGSPEQRASAALQYGIATILLNCLSKRPTLSDEQAQMEKLRGMASAGAQTPGKKLGEAGGRDRDPLDEDEAVEARVDQALEAGVVAAAFSLAKSASGKVRELDGRLLLSLVDQQRHRRPILAQGGGKVLLDLVRTLLLEKPKTEGAAVLPAIPQDGLSSIQALAKLVITTPPQQIFGPNPDSASLDYVRPLYVLLRHDDATLLQQFEALMALTNVASIAPTVAARIMTTPNLIVDVESKMLDDNVLVRRAAVQLVCNLVACEEGYTRYSGESANAEASPDRSAMGQRLHILLALTDVDDLPTRLAASGALASLSPSDGVIRALIALDSTGHKLMARLAGMLRPPDLAAEADAEGVEEISASPPDLGLVHRAVVILESTLIFVKDAEAALRDEILSQAKSCGLVRALMSMLAEWTQPQAARPSGEITEGVISALKMLKALGVDIAKEA